MNGGGRRRGAPFRAARAAAEEGQLGGRMWRNQLGLALLPAEPGFDERAVGLREAGVDRAIEREWAAGLIPCLEVVAEQCMA